MTTTRRFPLQSEGVNRINIEAGRGALAVTDRIVLTQTRDWYHLFALPDISNPVQAARNFVIFMGREPSYWFPVTPGSFVLNGPACTSHGPLHTREAKDSCIAHEPTQRQSRDLPIHRQLIKPRVKPSYVVIGD